MVPASAAASPPDICCKEELMLIKAPLSCILGIPVIIIEAGIILDMMPIKSRMLSDIIIQIGTAVKCVYINMKMLAQIVPVTKILNLSYLSHNLPTTGMMIMEEIPVAMKIIGNWLGETFRLLMAKALPNGISRNPPMDKNAVARKPIL